MDTITKAMLFGGKAIVSVIDARDIAQHAVDCHGVNDASGEALSRILALTAFMSAGIKGTAIKLSVTIDGNGSFGKIIACGVSGGLVRGYIENKSPQLPLRSGRYDMAQGLGQGEMTVIKDLGMKEPYVGKVELLKSNIDSDFAYYFTASEQLPSAVASGCKIKDGKVASCGAIVVQPMPNCDENTLIVLEDIVTNFTDFGQMLLDKSPKDIVDYYFGHFECKIIDEVQPRYQCNCSKKRMDSIVVGLGYDEAKDILDDRGEIEIHCDFCNTNYRYGLKDLNKLFGRS